MTVSIFEKSLFFIAMAAFGHSMCIPVPPNSSIAMLYPWWAKTYSFNSVQAHECLFMILLFGYSKGRLLELWSKKSNYGKTSIKVLFWLGVWCAIPSIFGQQPVKDTLRGFRLVVNGLIYLAVFDYTSNRSSIAIVSVVTGMIFGTIANLEMSQAYSLDESQMKLSGQNTPGVAMGIGIHLCAWWYFNEKRRLILIPALVFSAVLIYGCSISFSRTGWFAGATGLIALGLVFALNFKKSKLINTIVLVGCLCYFKFTANINNHINNFTEMFDKKVSNKAGGDQIRYAYFIISSEIAIRYPFGVGYSGYYNAQLDIAPNVEGAAIEEDELEANPHSSFLWYLVCGGIIGGSLALYLFINLSKIIYTSWLEIGGRVGAVVGILAIISYTVVALSVPYIFNSLIMLLPVAYIRGFYINNIKNKKPY